MSTPTEPPKKRKPDVNPWGWLRPSLRNPYVYLIANNQSADAEIDALLQILNPDDLVVHFNAAVWLSRFDDHPNNVLVLRSVGLDDSGRDKFWHSEVAGFRSFQAVYLLGFGGQLLPADQCPAPQYFVQVRQGKGEIFRHIRVTHPEIPTDTPTTTGFLTWFLNQMFEPILVGFTHFKGDDTAVAYHRTEREVAYLTRRGALYLTAEGVLTAALSKGG